MYKSFVNTGLVCLNIYDNFGWVHSSAALCTTLASFVIGESRTQREKLGTRFLTGQFMTLWSHKPLLFCTPMFHSSNLRPFLELRALLLKRCIVLRAKGMGLTAKGTGFLFWAPTTLEVWRRCKLHRKMFGTFTFSPRIFEAQPYCRFPEWGQCKNAGKQETDAKSQEIL